MIVGVTGGIGSGKTTVAKAFERLGIGYVDADDVAREVVAPGEPALAAIVAHFGEEVLASDGSLDRAALRTIIFADPQQRTWLESVTHPAIRKRLISHLDTLQREAPYTLLVSPLLFESGQDQMVSRTLVIDVPKNVQLERTLARDGVSEEQVHAILAAQLSRDARLAKADDVLDNSRDEAALMSQVVDLDKHYRSLVDKPLESRHVDNH